MTALQFAALILVALAGAAVVFTPEPLRQALVLATKRSCWPSTG